MTLPSVCMRCRGVLEPGFIVDRGDMDVLHEAAWASGTPRRRLLQTTAVEKGQRLLAIRTWRCTRCGLLETYSTE